MTVFKSADVNAAPICKVIFMENNEVKSFSNVKKGTSDWLKPQQKLKCYDFSYFSNFKFIVRKKSYPKG